MTKDVLITKAAKVLNENNIKKKVHIDKRILKFTDITSKAEEVSGQISVKAKDKEVRYTSEDVANVLEALIVCIQDVISKGEQVSIKGLGAFTVQYHKGRMVRNPITKEMMKIDGRYVPKFIIGQPLRAAAKLYELSLIGNPTGYIEPEPVYDRLDVPEQSLSDQTESGDVVDGC